VGSTLSPGIANFLMEDFEKEESIHHLYW
jgi:hypothetical protein